jgi:hypothetical protein
MGGSDRRNPDSREKEGCMSTIIKAGAVLGILAEAWTYIMGFTGWYKDPSMSALFLPVVIAIPVAVLYWALCKTAKEGRSYGGQVAAGLLICLIASVIIFIGSIIFTSYVFPEYFEEIRAMTAGQLEAAGMAEEEIQTTLDMQASVQTPFMQAIFGVIGTIVTGLVASLVIAIWVRKK